MYRTTAMSTKIQLLLFLSCGWYGSVAGNNPPIFTEDLSKTVLSESTPVGHIVGFLSGVDPEGAPLTYGLSDTDTFSVNTTTGEVTLVKPLDREENDTLNFFVTLEDDVNNLVSIPISVIIIDENDNPPTFKNLPYESVVPEDSLPGSTIFSQVLVEDPDLTGETLSVKCNDFPDFPGSCSKFEIITENASQKTYKGVIVLKEKVNYTETPLYHMELVAFDGLFNSKVGFEVKVGDIQDSPPIFKGSLFGLIKEDDPIGTLILTVHADDGDRGMPREIVYDLLSNPSDFFLLNSTTGELKTARPLDREALADTQGVATLKIRAREVVNGIPSDSPLESSVTTASVTIMDVNDEAPTFNQREYTVQLEENPPAGSALPNLNMTVADTDSGINSKFKLSLVDVSSSFTVEPSIASGSTPVTIRLMNGNLDYENPNNRKLIILVVAEETDTFPRLSSTATVTVVVTDANDNPPMFDRSAYSATIEETAYPGDPVMTITATDSDTGLYGTKGIVYDLRGPGVEQFSLDRKTGLITVSPCQIPGSEPCLDFESKQSYFLTLKATDNEGNGHISSVPVKITLSDSNDNPPLFTTSLYKAVIDEGSSKFEPPVIITAKDIDKTSEIKYRIAEGNVNDIFKIDPYTGEIKISGQITKNMTDDVISLVIEASDGIFRSNCTVEITVLDVNNNSPLFEHNEYHASIAEDLAVGSSVVSVKAFDADSGLNAELTYSLEDNNDFIIDNKTGVIYVATPLDFDRINDYTIKVTAVDGGIPSLSGTTTVFIKILNVNNKPPSFVPQVQTAQIKEDAKIGEIVYTLIAVDPDVSSPGDLNFASTEPITALDKHGNEVYESSAFKEFFNVDRTTGIVTVARRLDRELAAEVNITVAVTDITAPSNQKGYGNLIVTLIDVNDFVPTFLEPWTIVNPYYYVQLKEEQPAGTIVGQFTAIDKEGNNITYSIEPESELFSINETTGVVETKVKLDYEQQPSLHFKIFATDLGLPPLSSSAEITVSLININDMDPEFLQSDYEFKLNESATLGTEVGRVMAVDKDAGDAGKIIYSLDENGTRHFDINSSNGIIVVSPAAQLDAESEESIEFMVYAKDSVPAEEPRVASAHVKVVLVDANDNKPTFSKKEYAVSIIENVSVDPPAPIIQLSASDKDASNVLHYSIIFGNDNDLFMIDSTTGVIYPKASLRHKSPKYSLIVEVSDGLFVDTANVFIYILATNENQPVFVQPARKNSTVYIPENDDGSHALVMTVKAKDGDTGENGRLTYHFKVNDKNVQETEEFTIDENSGELRAKVSLDREKKKSYELVLVARDHGTTFFEVLRFLTIAVKDVDDNYPQFEQNLLPYTFHVMENLPPNSEVGYVRAIDEDEGENARVYYYILDGGEDVFSVDRVTGKISTLIELDREKRDSYELVIKASSQPDYYLSKDKIDQEISTSEDTIAYVKIIVLDENDNPPVFSKPEYYAGVEMTAKENEFLLQVSATDIDAGINGTIEYSILTSHLFKGGENVSVGSVIPSPFSISQNGEISTASPSEQYNQDRFKLEVIAKEKSTPFREAHAFVNVWIYEQNQLIKVILSRPPEEVHREKEEIISELSNATKRIVVIDEIEYHVDNFGNIQQDWCDMYLHVVEKKTLTISPITEVLRMIDSQYDFLKDYYAGFAIENVMPAYVGVKEETFEPALAALVALFIVLLAGCLSVLIVFCCFRHWVVSAPVDLKQSDMLIKKSVMDDLTTTENPLWIEQKLKLYEEQELTMHVFCEPENNQGLNSSNLDRRNSMDLSIADNTYATIQHSNRKGSMNRMLSLGGGEYATLGGSVLPLDNISSHSQQMFEAALGFQGSTFQVPENTDLFKARSELRLNKDGQPEFVSELM